MTDGRFTEGQTGTFTIHGTIYRVTPQDPGMDDIVTVLFSDAPMPVNFYSQDLYGKFEADVPEFEHGAIYRSKSTGEFWQFYYPAEDGKPGEPCFYTFGSSLPYMATTGDPFDLERVS